MQVKVKVTQLPDGAWDLLTSRGHRIGPRLHTIKPAGDDPLPEIPAGTFTDVMEAHRQAMHWNLYLAHAWKNRVKTNNRERE